MLKFVLEQETEKAIVYRYYPEGNEDSGVVSYDNEQKECNIVVKQFLTEEKRKELFEKRKYYREHPEEAKKAYAKRDDGVVIITPPEENK